MMIETIIATKVTPLNITVNGNGTRRVNGLCAARGAARKGKMIDYLIHKYMESHPGATYEESAERVLELGE